jgi:hypothetical protein
MNNDKTQQLTAKITESINALCAETDAAKQSAIYRAWLSTLSRFHIRDFRDTSEIRPLRLPLFGCGRQPAPL